MWLRPIRSATGSMEFSKEYWDSDPEASRKGKYASGEIFCTAMGIGNFDSFWYCEELFEGEPVYMGYPSPQGGQYQICVDSFYINAASPHAEGALDFLQYLLAEEQQRRLVTGLAWNRVENTEAAPKNRFDKLS